MSSINQTVLCVRYHHSKSFTQILRGSRRLCLDYLCDFLRTGNDWQRPEINLHVYLVVGRNHTTPEFVSKDCEDDFLPCLASRSSKYPNFLSIFATFCYFLLCELIHMSYNITQVGVFFIISARKEKLSCHESSIEHMQAPVKLRARRPRPLRRWKSLREKHLGLKKLPQP